MRRSVGLGAGIGSAAGAGVGAIADPGPDGSNRIRNVVIGTAVGGALGAGAGFLLDRNAQSDRSSSFEQGKKAGIESVESEANSPGASTPRLIPAKTEARWVPDQVRGNTFVPGHFEYLITEGARWETQ
ncbi:MAG: hypothetical protein ACXWOH_11390 [Bdellovibrionota bacterium]